MARAARTGRILLAWLKLLALDGTLARAKPKKAVTPPVRSGRTQVVDLFQLASAGIRWTVDNLRGDVALMMFHQFSRDHEFVRTRPVVMPFGLGLIFVSRSEARRLLDGLDQRFEEVEVYFAGVDDVGQGFVDELLRVWPSTHPGKTVTPINMNPAVEFMVRRGLARAQENRG